MVCRRRTMSLLVVIFSSYFVSFSLIFSPFHFPGHQPTFIISSDLVVGDPLYIIQCFVSHCQILWLVKTDSVFRQMKLSPVRPFSVCHRFGHLTVLSSETCAFQSPVSGRTAHRTSPLFASMPQPPAKASSDPIFISSSSSRHIQNILEPAIRKLGFCLLGLSYLSPLCLPSWLVLLWGCPFLSSTRPRSVMICSLNFFFALSNRHKVIKGRRLLSSFMSTSVQRISGYQSTGSKQILQDGMGSDTYVGTSLCTTRYKLLFSSSLVPWTQRIGSFFSVAGIYLAGKEKLSDESRRFYLQSPDLHRCWLIDWRGLLKGGGDGSVINFLYFGPREQGRDLPHKLPPFLERSLSSFSSVSERTFPPRFSIMENVFKCSVALKVLRAIIFVRVPILAIELVLVKELVVTIYVCNFLSFMLIALCFFYVLSSDSLATSFRRDRMVVTFVLC